MLSLDSSMDSLRLFLRTNSSRNSKKKLDLNDQYLRTNSNPDRINCLMLAQQSSSSAKLQSFLSAHPSSAVDFVRPTKKPFFDLETCSGLSTPTSEHSRSNHQIAASAAESICNVRSFTNHSRRKSWNKHYHRRRQISLSPPMRRTKSYRYAERLRKSASERTTRRHSQVNSARDTRLTSRFY